MRCTRLGVAHVRNNVATFFMSQYTNFMQFGGESDGATRCAQVTQLLAATWAQHPDENSLVVIQLDIVNAYPSADRQAEFNVLAGRASKSYDNGRVHMGDDILCPSSLRHYWSYFESMQGTASTLHFSDYQGQAHKIVCSKGGQQGDAFETDLDLDLDVPKFNCFFPGDRINDNDHTRALFQDALQANPQLACLSGIDAGISTMGLRVAGVPIGNDEWVQQFVQAKATAVQVDVGKLDIASDGLNHYQMLHFCQNA